MSSTPPSVDPAADPHLFSLDWVDSVCNQVDSRVITLSYDLSEICRRRAVLHNYVVALCDDPTVRSARDIWLSRLQPAHPPDYRLFQAALFSIPAGSHVVLTPLLFANLLTLFAIADPHLLPPAERFAAVDLRSRLLSDSRVCAVLNVRPAYHPVPLPVLQRALVNILQRLSPHSAPRHIYVPVRWASRWGYLLVSVVTPPASGSVQWGDPCNSLAVPVHLVDAMARVLTVAFPSVTWNALHTASQLALVSEPSVHSFDDGSYRLFLMLRRLIAPSSVPAEIAFPDVDERSLGPENVQALCSFCVGVYVSAILYNYQCNNRSLDDLDVLHVLETKSINDFLAPHTDASPPAPSISTPPFTLCADKHHPGDDSQTDDGSSASALTESHQDSHPDPDIHEREERGDIVDVFRQFGRCGERFGNPRVQPTKKNSQFVGRVRYTCARHRAERRTGRDACPSQLHLFKCRKKFGWIVRRKGKHNHDKEAVGLQESQRFRSMVRTLEERRDFWEAMCRREALGEYAEWGKRKAVVEIRPRVRESVVQDFRQKRASRLRPLLPAPVRVNVPAGMLMVSQEGLPVPVPLSLARPLPMGVPVPMLTPVPMAAPLPVVEGSKGSAEEQ